MNKGWEIQVPAAAVILEPLVVINFIESKTSVAGSKSSYLKFYA